MRAKYLDWCSAHLADHFLALSPDEIFELAERATQEEHSSGRPLSSSTDPDEQSSYRVMVERVASVLTRQLDLPNFQEWRELYRQNPAAVEARLLGFWKEGL